MSRWDHTCVIRSWYVSEARVPLEVDSVYDRRCLRERLLDMSQRSSHQQVVDTSPYRNVCTQPESFSSILFEFLYPIRFRSQIRVSLPELLRQGDLPVVRITVEKERTKERVRERENGPDCSCSFSYTPCNGNTWRRRVDLWYESELFHKYMWLPDLPRRSLSYSIYTEKR